MWKGDPVERKAMKHPQSLSCMSRGSHNQTPDIQREDESSPVSQENG